MGQRLNIEITNNEEVIANAYYHWSGYTRSALDLTKIIIDEIKNYDNQIIIEEGNNVKDIVDKIELVRKNNKELLFACKLLRSTGARFTEDEIEFIKENYDEQTFSEFYNDGEEAARNYGLIAVTEKGMESTRSCEEARVTIDLYSKSVDFDAICSETKEEYKEDCLEDLAEVDFYIHDIPFDNFEYVYFNLTHILSTSSAFMYKDYVYEFIE